MIDSHARPTNTRPLLGCREVQMLADRFYPM
jgi:hypothetical protein